MTFPQSVIALVGNDGKRVTAISPPSTQTGNLNLVGSAGINVVSTGPNTMTISGSGSNVISTITGNSGSPVTGPNVNLVGAGSISVGGSGSTLTVSASYLGIPWNNNATSRALVSNNGYIITTGAQIFTLPTSPSIGDLIELILNGGTSWTITLSGKKIKNASTTYSNSVSSYGSDGISLRIVCVNIASNWVVDSLVGSLIGT